MAFLHGRRLPAVAAVLAALAVAAPGTAQAAPAGQFGVEAQSALLATGGGTRNFSVGLINSGDDDVVLTGLTVVVDTAGLAGAATVDYTLPNFGGDCTTRRTVTTCTYATFRVPIINSYPLSLGLKPAPGAAAGTTGTYRVTAEATGLPAGGATGTVTLAETVDLIAGPEITLSGRPGSTLALKPDVRNASSRIVRGAVLSSSTGSRSAAYRPQYRNCVYTDAEFYCEFDRDLAPGRHYTPASAVAVALTGDAPAPSEFETYAEWQTPADAGRSMEAIRRRGGRAGTGPVLRLVENAPALRAPAQSGPPAQSDPSAGDNFQHVVTKVTGKNPPDLAATGTTVRGTVGQTVTATFGIRNLGPARIDSLDEFPSALVVIPAGTTVAKADRNCVPVQGGSGTYRCLAGVLTVGGSAKWSLDLTITDAAPSTGTITARTEIVGEDTFGPDRDPSNNRATILLNPPPGQGEEDGGEGGGLPITGTGTARVAGAGAALLLAGAAVFLVARRRRTRYVA